MWGRMSIRQGRQCLTTPGGGGSSSGSSVISSSSSNSSSNSSSSCSSSSKGLELVYNINEKMSSRNFKRGGLGQFGLLCYKKNAWKWPGCRKNHAVMQSRAYAYERLKLHMYETLLVWLNQDTWHEWNTQHTLKRVDKFNTILWLEDLKLRHLLEEFGWHPKILQDRA
jgi:hypothetical protein